ncbi:hypothetical protein BRADI_3g24746v3 [Brachypodium distachyon]|uniref:Uncharacterized protein n=1 Tax=Brachypodium distachyon TaxID=15368 RepID=A0A0Q3Q4J7_BRADI|nr:hypothetical protein BRADI_3g24746v3 [Brachypodium distachyon]
MRHRQRRLGLVAERAHGEQAPIAASSRAIDLLAAVVSTISSVGSYITVAAMRLGQSREVGVSTRRWSLLAPVRRRHQWLSIPHPSGMRSRFVPCGRKFWGFPLFAEDCASGHKTMLDQKSDISELCSQMMLKLHDVYDANKGLFCSQKTCACFGNLKQAPVV